MGILKKFCFDLLGLYSDEYCVKFYLIILILDIICNQWNKKKTEKVSVTGEDKESKKFEKKFRHERWYKKVRYPKNVI